MKLLLRVLVWLTLGATLTACGVNPVTGRKEIQFISEAQEVRIGEQHYAPTRQSQGGDMEVLPELTAYVNAVGQKLAAVADRPLPYEFVVLNNSVPNAWALPGGKIAVNHGLLTELKNEAELAAVLGHEIVHAAARHGAKAQERGALITASVALAQVGAAMSDMDPNVAGLLVGGSALGAQLIQHRYGREQELEADEYGMKYMKLAGYDPAGAITLQETFLRLSQQEGARQRSWLEGLFATHPPSQERVEKNRLTAQRLGGGGSLGEQAYAAQIQPLLRIKPAYDKLEQAQAAARQKDFQRAQALAGEAVKIVPREGRFHEFLGELALGQDKPAEALPHYQKAIDLNPRYFGSYLGAGVAKYRVGDKPKAEEWLRRSSDLLPTAPASYYLGEIAKDRGDRAQAVQYFRTAAASDSQIGKRAARELMRLDVPQNPGSYIAASGRIDAQGRLIVVVHNRAAVPITAVQVTPVRVDAAGRVVQQGAPIRFDAVVEPGGQALASYGVGAITQEELTRLRFRVDSANVAE